MALVGASMGAPTFTATLTTAVRVGTASTSGLLRPAAPAPVDLGHVLACILATRTPPRSAAVTDLGIFLHRVLLFHFLDARFCPFAGTVEMEHVVALRTGPHGLLGSHRAVADHAVVLTRSELSQKP